MYLHELLYVFANTCVEIFRRLLILRSQICIYFCRVTIVSAVATIDQMIGLFRGLKCL
jgi:hypothetical protein